MKHDIKTRADISTLVHQFYGTIRRDDLLGPIFHHHIADDQWAEHLEKLTDFWETNLFGVAKFKGNPTVAHLAVDKHHDYGIGQIHFGRWLQVWFATITDLFEGENADKAKEAARRMAHTQFMVLWYQKPNSVKCKTA